MSLPLVCCRRRRPLSVSERSLPPVSAHFAVQATNVPASAEQADGKHVSRLPVERFTTNKQAPCQPTGKQAAGQQQGWHDLCRLPAFSDWPTRNIPAGRLARFLLSPPAAPGKLARRLLRQDACQLVVTNPGSPEGRGLSGAYLPWPQTEVRGHSPQFP